MSSPYGCEHPYNQLRMLQAESNHVRSLALASGMISKAFNLIKDTEEDLSARKASLLANAWGDEGGVTFADEVNKSIRSMTDYRAAITSAGIAGRINHLSLQFPNIYNALVKVCQDYKKAYDADKDKTTKELISWCQKAAAVTDQLDVHYRSIDGAMRKFATEAPDWTGPRAALAAPGNPKNNNPTSPSGNPVSSAGSPTEAGDPASPGTPEPATVPETPETPGEETPSATDQLTDALSAATSALEAAESLLGGGQVPDAIPVTDLPGMDVGDPLPYQPSLAGLEPAAFGGGAPGGGAASAVGGAAVGSANTIGPLTGGAGAIGAGLAPTVAGGLARGLASAAATGGMPPMMPPGAGAGAAAGARAASAGIKPGNSDRPVAESRPRPRRGTAPVTPGVALTGRAGAAAPKPAARRSWDEENDSLQVLDEHLWQVNPPEEEPHGQDRRRPGGDGRDGTTAHRSPDARLAWPGGRADQPTRAR